MMVCGFGIEFYYDNLSSKRKIMMTEHKKRMNGVTKGIEVRKEKHKQKV